MQEANRESAARSRDRRLKLISDLEEEVGQLKRKLAYYQVWPFTTLGVTPEVIICMLLQALSMVATVLPA